MDVKSQKLLNLLLIDDDDLVAESIRLCLPTQWQMTHSSDAKKIPPGLFSAAFVDIHLTGNLKTTEGIEMISRLRLHDPHLEIVAISGDLDREVMETCLHAGASRFLPKPLSSEELSLTLDKIEALQLLRETSTRYTTSEVYNWIGSSLGAETVRRNIASLRGEAGPILIEGESGSGKEVAAQLLHAQEGSGRPLVSVNVATLPENVFESEFFGHARGAFTGANQNKMGLAEAAHNGDLFLDEIEALPLSQQAKLLRFLESGEVRRVGAKDSVRVNVRVISATNRSLEAMVKDGQFREDLLYRLNARKLLLPPLRDRRDDIRELALHFLEKERPRRNKTLAADAIEALSRYHWPGNVRELKRAIEQLSLQSPLPLIRAEDVKRWHPGVAATDPDHREYVDLSRGLTELLSSYEAWLIRLALEKSKDIDAAAQLLDISRSSLYKKIRDYGIDT